MAARLRARSAAFAAGVMASIAATTQRRVLMVVMRIPAWAHVSTRRGGLRPRPPLVIVARPNPRERQSVMTRSWVACSLALALVGLAASAATAENVTAFNPYKCVGPAV